MVQYFSFIFGFTVNDSSCVSVFTFLITEWETWNRAHRTLRRSLQNTKLTESQNTDPERFTTFWATPWNAQTRHFQTWNTASTYAGSIHFVGRFSSSDEASSMCARTESTLSVDSRRKCNRDGSWKELSVFINLRAWCHTSNTHSKLQDPSLLFTILQKSSLVCIRCNCKASDRVHPFLTSTQPFHHG